MDWFRKLFTRAKAWITRRDTDAEIDAELQTHRDERAAELQEQGLSRQDAQAQARREVGNSLRAIEDTRAAWHLGWIEDLATDLRYGMRGLLRDRTFALTAIASLALGIGVNTTIFSLAMELLFSTPSVHDADSIVAIRLGGNSHADQEDIRIMGESGLYRSVVGFREGQANWRNGETSRRLFTFVVTPNYFTELGIPLAAGRPLTAADTNGIVISHRFWKSQFNGDSSVLGRSMVIDGKPRNIVAILPDHHRTVFGYALSPDAYVPVATPIAGQDLSALAIFARLPEGVSVGEGLERTRSMASRLDSERPIRTFKRTAGLQVSGLTGLDRLRDGDLKLITLFFGLLMAIVNLILLIACVNVASLLLARATVRAHELAVRTSIGASRSRIVRQLLAESFLLAAFATGAGIAMNVALSSVLNNLVLPLPVPLQLQIETDWRLLTYSAGLAFGCAMAAGLLPSIQAARASGLGALLNLGSRQTGSGSRLRSMLLIGQVAVTVVVVTMAILFARNLAHSSSLTPGFEVGRLVWASMRMVPERYPTDVSFTPLLSTGLERLRALPGVESASLLQVVPFNDGSSHGGQFRADGVESALRFERAYNTVGPDFFRTMGIRLTSGREFREGEKQAAIVNHAFVRRVWGDGVDPVGKVLRMPSPLTIVGVCANTKFQTIGEEDRPAIFEPYKVGSGERAARVEWMVRTANPLALTHGIEQALLDLDPTAVAEVRPMVSAMGLAFLPSQVGAVLMGSAGTLGLVLASVGLYGVLLYAVTRRTREIGVRLALGASTWDVLRLVLGDSLRTMGIGVLIGFGIAWFVMKPLAMFLVEGLKPDDPLTFVGVAALFATVVLAASASPAWRAVRVAPTEALRSE